MMNPGSNEKERLGDILVRWGIINEGVLYEALEIQKKTKKRLGEILVEKGFATEQQITEALAQEYRLPIMNLSKVEIDPKLLEIFSYQTLKKYNILPVQIDGDNLVVATTDPLNIAAFRELGYISGYRIRPVMAPAREIEAFINKYFGPMRSAEEALREVGGDQRAEVGTEEESLAKLESAAQEAPVVKLVNSVLTEAIEQKTSDVHFEPQKDNMRVRFRIDGILYEKITIPKHLQAAVISRIKIISGMDVAERRKPQDGRMSITTQKEGKNKTYDIRVSTLPDIFGEKVVLRILDKSSVIRPLESLGFEEEDLKKIKSLIFQPYGMMLVTGPTGSGKTTTLYSVLNILNDTSRNIITVEDPVEYELDGINQTAVNVRAGYTFATAIRHILRQDPDVIMIGEIRDLETAEIAIQAALTGHMVFSTLHTNSAPGAITRLLDMNVEPFLIGSAVIGVLAQRLVRRLCPACRKEIPLSETAKAEIMDSLPEDLKDKELTVAVPVGCEKCHNLGYSGRVNISEILVVDDTIKEMVLRRSTETEITQVALNKGMRTLRMSGIRKALQKLTSLEEVVRVTFVKRNA